jgi:hypothetical protein
MACEGGCFDPGANSTSVTLPAANAVLSSLRSQDVFVRAVHGFVL